MRRWPRSELLTIALGINILVGSIKYKTFTKAFTYSSFFNTWKTGHFELSLISALIYWSFIIKHLKKKALSSIPTLLCSKSARLWPVPKVLSARNLSLSSTYNSGPILYFGEVIWPEQNFPQGSNVRLKDRCRIMYVVLHAEGIKTKEWGSIAGKG